MNYHSQQRDFDFHHEQCSHDVLQSAAIRQREQEAKDKEILRIQAATALQKEESLRLQAAAALQKEETETWCLKIKYQSMMQGIGASQGDAVPGPSFLLPSFK